MAHQSKFQSTIMGKLQSPELEVTDHTAVTVKKNGAADECHSTPFLHHGVQDPNERMALPTRHVQRPGPYTILDSVKLTINATNHSVLNGYARGVQANIQTKIPNYIYNRALRRMNLEPKDYVRPGMRGSYIPQSPPGTIFTFRNGWSLGPHFPPL